MSRVGVTGASGFIGERLLRRLRARGHEVVTIGRRRASAGLEHRDADLCDAPPPGLLAGLDALVHLAANTGGRGASPAQELAFARGLVEQAGPGCQLVFLSSQAASADAPSDYGRSKAAIEASMLPAGAAVVRPGLVYGRGRAGLFALLERLVRRAPVLPDFRWPAPRVQPVHVDDLADAVERIVARRSAGLFAIGGEPISFTAFLRAIARERLDRRRLALPVPVALLRALLGVLRPLPGVDAVRARIASLLALSPLDAAPSLATLGLTLRPLDAGLRDGAVRRHRLLREASLLARALLGAAAPPALLRRYVRALAAFGVHDALAWPRWMGPALVAALDRPRARRAARVGDAAWRMRVVLRLAEAEPALAPRFLGLPAASGAGRARLRAVAALLTSAALELRARGLAPLAWLGRPRP